MVDAAIFCPSIQTRARLNSTRRVAGLREGNAIGVPSGSKENRSDLPGPVRPGDIVRRTERRRHAASLQFPTAAPWHARREAAAFKWRPGPLSLQQRSALINQRRRRGRGTTQAGAGWPVAA
jgi:hypothetical protein